MKYSNLTILVLKEFWEVEELRDELLYVVGVVHKGLPCRWDGVELAIRAVEPETRRDEKSVIMTINSCFVQTHALNPLVDAMITINIHTEDKWKERRLEEKTD